MTASALINRLLLPPGGIVLLLACALALTARRPTLARRLIIASTAALAVLSMPRVADSLTRLTGRFDAFDPARAPAAAQAIVVLSAERRQAEEYGGSTLGDRTMERLRFGARIARASHLPLLVSGGRIAPRTGDPSLAEMMKQVLHSDFGCDVKWLEDKSTTTHENAVLSAPILQAAGVRTVVLVTDYVHMNRAMHEFTRAGMQVVPAPVRMPPAHYEERIAAVIPDPRALRDSALALHELLGLALLTAGGRN